MNWEIIYSECNTHLREQDTKRDQIVAFFIALTGFVSGMDFFNKNSYAFILSFVLFLLGCLMSIILVRYKMWHEKYVLAAITVSAAMKNNRDCTINEFSEYFNESIKKKRVNSKEVFISSESMILNSFLLCNTINLFLGFFYLDINFIWLIPIITVYFILFNFNLYRSMKKLYSANTKFESIWILRFWR